MSALTSVSSEDAHLERAHTRRVLLTGSRAWTDRDAIHAVLDAERAIALWAAQVPVLVHGACARGADALAAAHAQRTGWVVEAHPADWNAHGRGAGPTRNKAMVASGVDVCVAFPLGASRGTRGCMALAAAAGVPVFEFEPGYGQSELAEREALAAMGGALL